MEKQKRTRKQANLTLSDAARAQGKAVAEYRGIKLSQLVEQLLREEFRRAGIQTDTKEK